MTKHLFLSCITGLCLGLVIAACNNDNPEAEGYGVDQENTNSNATRGFSGVTESSSTNLKEVANRLEIPQLNQTGTNNLFVVHTVPGFGVNYCMEYDCNLKAQRWAAFRWDSSNYAEEGSRTDAWAPDPLIPEAYRTDFIDHNGNGYTRGHIVSSKDRICPRQVNEQTFYYSNMHPQLYGFNTQGIWWNIENKLIRERYCNFDIQKSGYFCDTLYVVKGGTIDNNNFTWAKGKGQSLVCPKYFFVALLRKSSKDTTQGGYAAIGFWMEHKVNEDTKYADYVVSIDRLEELTGIDFFCNLPDKIEAQVERNLVTSLWGIF